MFTYKNKISNQNTYYQHNRKNNFGFSCGGSSNQYSNKSSGPSNRSSNGVFSSLHNELNNNINLINRENKRSNSMFRKNGMFPKKRGCGCRAIES